MRRLLPTVLLVAFVAIILLQIVLLLWGEEFSFANKKDIRADASYVKTLTQEQASFDDFVDFFTDIAKKKGGVYAFDLMRVSEFPFGLDQHLLGHSVGDILYEQKGISGMSLCTQDFRNACSHTMVIGALLEFGEGVLPKIREACHLAPGGSGAYTMCFHGLGHGVLAYNLYDMNKTAAMCQEFGTPEYGNREAVECFGGAVMEIIGGGGHDREYWEVNRQKYLNPTEPFGFCESEVVPDDFRSICYTYMTPFAFEAVGANMSMPGKDAFEKTFAFCEKVPDSDLGERRSCFEGLGKEFIGIATGRDLVLQGGPTEGQLEKMRDWCMLARPSDGKKYCFDAVAGSLYWGGEKPYESVLQFCSMLDDEYKKDCYLTTVRNVSQYVADPIYRRGFCEASPEVYREMCNVTLLN